jgi:Limiting CO2-inducible proteins B/C beta carbonyic anhydrases
MASHIPNHGNCFIVCGPHVGIDATRQVGMVDGGSCCGSVIALAKYVEDVKLHGADVTDPPTEPIDAQQAFVGQM